MNEKRIKIFVIAILVMFCLIFLLFLRGQQRNETLFMQFSIERRINRLFEAYRAGALEKSFRDVRDVRDVRGFGVYLPDGRAISAVGSAPEHLNIKRVFERGQFNVYDRESKSVKIIRPLMNGKPPPPAIDRGHGHGMRRHMKHFMPGMDSEFIFMELYVRGYFIKRGIYRLSFLIIPLLFIILTLFFFKLYRINLGYRERAEKNEQLAILGEASRTLSHEIKNPLGSMKLQVAYLKRVLKGEHDEELSILDEEISRLSLLTSRVGDFLRDPKGEPAEVDIVTFLRELIGKRRQNIVFKNHTADMPKIFVDYHRLQSILENVIQNALESYENGDSEREVEIYLEDERGGVKVIVLDRGCGIKSGDVKQIFDPFYTTKTKGSGIGLSITKRFLEAIGGSIEYSQRENGGTKVVLSFERVWGCGL